MRHPFLLLAAASAVLSVGGCGKPRQPVARESVVEGAPTPPQDLAPPHNPKELGWVVWERDYDRAARLAEDGDKPIFLLFQEVPGCSTCVGFGESVLSHPLLIEAIEELFVPVAIHNNRGGKDRETLDRFSEPPWNNPVVRLVDSSGHDLVPRADDVWSTHGIAERMIQALRKAGRPVPDYLRWALAGTAPTGSATFSMACYWSGEACLGAIDGVVETTAGSLDGREVVEVAFDPSRISEADLHRLATERGCGRLLAHPAPARAASDADRKYHLERSALRHLPLTPLQAARVNAALARGDDPRPWLSPRQRDLLERVTAAGEAPLAGLVRPRRLRDLARYEWELRARLETSRSLPSGRSEGGAGHRVRAHPVVPGASRTP